MAVKLGVDSGEEPEKLVGKDEPSLEHHRHVRSVRVTLAIGFDRPIELA